METPGQRAALLDTNLRVLYQSLPLIADVVEAAEAFVALPDTTVADAGPALMERLTKTYAALPAALTALQEHLEGGDVT